MANEYSDTQQLDGFEDLHDKLIALGAAAGGKALKTATYQAMLPAKKHIKTKAPVGKRRSHTTYRGRVVERGFGKRSINIKRVRLRSKSVAMADIGVKKEAFYIIQFYDRVKVKANGPPWFRRAFSESRYGVQARLRERLKRQIDKASATG